MRELCDGSGTVELTTMRRDFSWAPLPCPVCGQEVPTGLATPANLGSPGSRVYLAHLPSEAQ